MAQWLAQCLAWLCICAVSAVGKYCNEMAIGKYQCGGWLWRRKWRKLVAGSATAVAGLWRSENQRSNHVAK